MIELFGHPFSSYTWKAEIALIEKGADYVFRPINGDGHPENVAALQAIWPLSKFPVLKHGERGLFEASIIVEYVDQLSSDGPNLLPADPAAALDVRLMDRVFDNHVMTPAQSVVFEHIPSLVPVPDPVRIERARAALEQIYGWLETRMTGQTWATPHGFTLADCAAAPSLFYADWVHPIGDHFVELKAYRARLLARPSVAQCIEAARPYRHYFPLSAPDRD